MNKSKFIYGIFGMFIGVVLGGIAGIGELNYVKKSLRTDAFPVLLIGGAIILGVTGLYTGIKYGENEYAEEILGFKETSDQLYQVGRFWTKETRWVDKVNGSSQHLITKRNDSGELCTSFNSAVIYNHNLHSGSKINVEKYHSESKKVLFKTLKNQYLSKNTSDPNNT